MSQTDAACLGLHFHLKLWFCLPYLAQKYSAHTLCFRLFSLLAQLSTAGAETLIDLAGFPHLSKEGERSVGRLKCSEERPTSELASFFRMWLCHCFYWFVPVGILSCEAITLASQVRVYCGVSPPGAVSMRPEDIIYTSCYFEMLRISCFEK